MGRGKKAVAVEVDTSTKIFERRDFFESMPSPVFLFTADADRKLRIVAINRNLAELIGNNGPNTPEKLDRSLAPRLRDLLADNAFGSKPPTVFQAAMLPDHAPFAITVMRIDQDSAAAIITTRPAAEKPQVKECRDLILVLGNDGQCLSCHLPPKGNHPFREEDLLTRFPADYLSPGTAEDFQTAIRKASQSQQPQELNFQFDGPLGMTIYEARFFPHPGRIVCLLHNHAELLEVKEILHRSEERFKTIFENAPLGITLIDRDFRLVLYNQNIERITGYSADELRQKRICDMTYPEDVTRCRQLYIDLFDQKISRFEVEKRFVRKNGELTWVSVTVSLLKDSCGNLAIELIEEITQRKTAESLLQQTETRLQELKTVARVGYWQYDHHNRKFSCDPELLQILGYDHADANLSQLISRSIIPSDRFKLIRSYTEAVKNRNDINLVHRILDADGQMHYFFQRGRTEFTPEGKPCRTVGMSYDVSEIQHAHNRLETNNRIFEALVTGTQRLLEARMPLLAFGDLLHSLGGALNSDRACYFEIKIHHDQTVTCHLNSEFVRETTPAHQAPAAFHSLLASSSTLLKTLQTNRVHIEGNVADAAPEMQGFMNLNRICSLLAAPIFVRNELRGVIITEDCNHERQWSDSEIDGLKIFTETIGLVLSLRERESELQTAIERAEKNELLLKKNELRLKNLIDALPDSLYVHNRAGYILDYHAPNHDDLLMPPEKFLGRHVREIMPAFLADKTLESISQVLQTGKAVYFQYELSYEDEIRSFDARMLPYGQDLVLAVIRNVTELQKMRHAVLTSEAKFKQLFQRMINAATIFEPVFDRKNNNWRYRIIDANPSYEQLAGQPRLQLLNHYVDELFPASDLSWLDLLHEVATTGESKTFQFNHREADRYYYCSAFKPERMKKYFCVIFHDITSQKKNESDLIKAKEKAEESDRLKSSFLSNMSHEIRTPLNTIVGLSNLLAENELSQTEKIQYSTLINQSSTQLLTLISDIIDIARIENGQLRISVSNVNINDICNKLQDIFQNRIDQQKQSRLQLVLNKSLDNAEATVATDETRLTQVLTNLLGNSLKFTPYGKIEFGYRLQKENRMLLFYVKDTGPGIPKDKQKQIFERFRQVDESFSRQYGGAGLGLSISKNLVELMGGKIWMESQSGQGSSFYFTIPFHRLSETASEKLRKQEVVAPTVNYSWPEKTVLIADDTQTVQFYLKTLLEMAQVKCLIASNGLEAVEMCRNNPEIDLVLMDIQMPIMNGYEAITAIKAMRKDLPIIAQTAYAFASDQEKIISTGCDSCLTKPVRKEALFKKLATIFPTPQTQDCEA